MTSNELSKSPNFLNCFLMSGPVVSSFLSEIAKPDEDSFIPFDYVYRCYELWLKTKNLPSFHFMTESRFSYIVNNIGAIAPAHLLPTDKSPLVDLTPHMAYKTKSRVRVITGFCMRPSPILLLGTAQFEFPTEKEIGPFIMNQTSKLAHVLALYRRRALQAREEAAKPFEATSITSMYKSAYIEELNHLLRTEQVTPEESRVILSRIEAGEHMTDILKDMEEKQKAGQPLAPADQESSDDVEYREDDATDEQTLIDNTAT